MSRGVLLSLYAMLVVVWSSTWVAIKFGLEETPPLLGAGARFVLAGAVLLAVTALRRRPLRTDARLTALLAVLPFATAYALVYYSEQYIPSGLTAVLFGALPVYVAVLAGLMLRDEPSGVWLYAGLGLAIAGLCLAFGESLSLGHHEKAALGALAGVLAPLAGSFGNIGIKRRGAGLDPVTLNGWAMLLGGTLLLVVSAPLEDWGGAVWSGQAVGAIAYLALVGSAVPFVVLTILLVELGAVTMSYIPLMIPFGALILGALFYDEALTVWSLAGAGLVGAGLVVAQRRARRPEPALEPARAPGSA